MTCKAEFKYGALQEIVRQVEVWCGQRYCIRKSTKEMVRTPTCHHCQSVGKSLLALQGQLIHGFIIARHMSKIATVTSHWLSLRLQSDNQPCNNECTIVVIRQRAASRHPERI